MDFDPFEVLELKPCGDKAQIKKAYYRLALKLHPDKLEPDKPKDSRPFRRMKKAYDFLWEMGTKALAEFVLNFAAQKEHRELARRLIIAAQNGRMNEARRLLKRGADPRETGTVTVDGQMINKVTSFRIAAFKGHLEMCKLLVAHGTANDVDQDNKWIVCAACYGGHLDIVKHFFGTGIDNCWRLALAAASFHGRDDVLWHLLSEEKASCRQSSEKKEEKASAGRSSDKEGKASAGRSSDKERRKRNPSRNSLMGCPKILIKFGPKRSSNVRGAKLTIDGKAITGLSPLCIVTSKRICEHLIKNGANVDKKMGNRQTPLFCACIRGNFEIVKCLVENGADINAVDKLGRTPLMAAAFHGHAGLVRYLLKRGARIDLATNAVFLEWESSGGAADKRYRGKN
uniref:J domain-containing protein n=1 Tax=Globodera pallida TaxID=36090 RepID=A0A183BQR6_GLOPA